MNQKIEEYLNSLRDECIKAAIFMDLSDEQKNEKREQLGDYLFQVVTNNLLTYLTKEELDVLETINFESEEGVAAFGKIVAALPGFVFLEVGDKLRQEVEKIKKSGQIPQ